MCSIVILNIDPSHSGVELRTVGTWGGLRGSGKRRQVLTRTFGTERSHSPSVDSTLYPTGTGYGLWEDQFEGQTY